MPACASVRECHPSRLIHALRRTYFLRDGSFPAEGCVDLHWLTVLGDHRSERDPWIPRVSRPTVLIGRLRQRSGMSPELRRAFGRAVQRRLACASSSTGSTCDAGHTVMN